MSHISNFKKRVLSFRTSQRGLSLLEVALFIMALGMITVVGAQIYTQRMTKDQLDVTADRLEVVHKAIERFKETNRRLPAPAPMNAQPDTANYGVEGPVITVLNAGNINSTATAVAGTNLIAVAARGNRAVRTGTIPVRTLGLGDEFMQDAYGHRIVYAVTQEYLIAPPGVPTDPNYQAGNLFNYDRGAITIQDSGLNNAGTPTSVTSGTGNVIYALVAPGADPRGAFSAAGIEKEPCPVDPAVDATLKENCFNDATPDATFSSTIAVKGEVGSARGFSNKLTFEASKNLYNWWTSNPDNPGNPALWVPEPTCQRRDTTPLTSPEIPGTCWDGKQHRTVQCRQGNGALKADVFCAQAGPKPAETKNCAMPACYWDTTWSGCGCDVMNTPNSICRRTSDNQQMDGECGPVGPAPIAYACPACPPPPPPPPPPGGGGGGGSCGDGICNEDPCNCERDCPRGGCDSSTVYQITHCMSDGSEGPSDIVASPSCCCYSCGLDTGGPCSSCPSGSKQLHACSEPWW